MKKLITLAAMFLLSGILLFSGCKKDDNNTPVLPTVTLKAAAGYISADAQAAYGDTLKFGISLAYNETDNLVKLTVTRNSATVVDSTINATTFTMDLIAKKNVESQEVWKFEATDIAGNVNAVTVTVTGAFGAINQYPSITLGAQANATVPSFLSYSNNTFTTYLQSEAFNHQSDIDMFCFYEDTPGHQNFMTLAAPGSNITGIFTGATSPENYTTKNVTYFVKTTLTAADFDAVANDAKILNAFDPANKFKKAKTLTAGDVYAFMLQSGKYGLLKVLTVTGTTDGTLEFAVKIQH